MSKLIFFLLLILSVGFFSSEVYRRWRATRLGRPEDRSDRRRERWKYFFTQVVLQQKIRKYPWFGLMHVFMAAGFPVLGLSSINMAVAGLYHAALPLIGDNAIFLAIRDLFMALVILGVCGFILRRTVKKPDWLHNSWKAFGILLLILVVAGSELLFYAVQVSLAQSPQGGAWLVAPVSYLFAGMSKAAASVLLESFWWLHFLAIFAFLFIIPRSKHLHLVFAPFNTYWHSLAPKGSHRPVQLAGEPEETYGAGKLEDFSWKQLLDAFSCVKCGRCHGSCPAFQSGEELKLKKINGRLRTQMERKALGRGRGSAGISGAKERKKAGKKKFTDQGKLIAGVVKEEDIWSCTTCGACEEACPVSCEHISKLIDMRRHLVSSKQRLAPEIEQVFYGIENYGNPWGKKREWSTAFAWAEELGIPTLAAKPAAQYLYFVGCTPAHDESARRAAVAFAKILKQAGVDFAILGAEESCCGETARRLGNEALFQTAVKRNIAAWNSRSIRKIITACAHCFNTLHNEYPQFDGNFEVIPHVKLLADLLQKGRLKPQKARNITATFHDSCYLGRYNAFYDEPREILKAIPGVSLIEMPRSRENSFCCGAGGGRFWQKAENAITQNRAQEAQATGAEVVCTTCPYCRIVLDKEIGCMDKGIRTADITEILEESL